MVKVLSKSHPTGRLLLPNLIDISPGSCRAIVYLYIMVGQIGRRLKGGDLVSV
jgi:hypothetical protein